MSNRLQDLTNRIAAIRLQRKAIAAKSGLDESTIGRTLNVATVPLSSTLDRIESVLSAEEIRLARHLATLPHVQAALAADRDASEAA
ncbi:MULTISPECIES: hypothetical protein [Rhodopseudomonas]|uniref:HTH cro/C1-type domain-containing protein n=1 Tax=Rhodopseudomonas palustris TaxID=1076 RepID=A0A0D7EEV3_RHOPL|nr:MULTISPECIES: hypothetical protein [Rhodopseudomonas]KIZ39060.1 hypothetical protein OO17_21620 [Rhodopseudomonas palustris]MDF3809287.1 hypothetical protein [Rhodopseudomonas sp. BAL398]WOK19030.1 hypothetical protein RBJ75_05790 [Rhodopseudomonas sp. BAL398]